MTSLSVSTPLLIEVTKGAKTAWMVYGVRCPEASASLYAEKRLLPPQEMALSPCLPGGLAQVGPNSEPKYNQANQDALG